MKKVNRKCIPFFFFRSCTANSDLMNKVCTLVHVWQLLSYLKFIFWALSLLGGGFFPPPILMLHLQIKTENKNSANQLFSSVQFSSVAQSCPTLCDPMNRSMPGLPVHHQLPEFTQTPIESVMPSSHLILCRPLLLLPPIPPNIRVFPNESTLCMRWPKYWSFSFSISPSNEHPGLVSFRMDWLDLLAVQGTLKSLLQHHSSKASILRRSAFFTVQISHPYVTTGKTIVLTRWTFVGKVMSLLLNMLSRLVITFLPGNIVVENKGKKRRK